MCLLRLDPSSLAGVLHATDSWQNREFSSSPVLNFMQAASEHCLWICLHRSCWGTQAGIRLCLYPFFTVCEVVYLCSWNRLLAYWGNTMLPGSLEMPKRNDDASMYFLTLFLWIVFSKVQIPMSCRTMHSFWLMFVSAFHSRLQEQASQAPPRQSFLWDDNNAEITRGEGGHSSLHLSPSTPGIPCCLKLPKSKAGWIPSCCSVLHTASIFSQGSLVNYE